MKRAALFEYFRLYFCAFGIQQAETRRIPNLVCEVAIRLDLLLIPANVGAPDLGQRETRSIDPKLVKHIDWIHSIHLCLRHALALGVENCSGDEDVFKRLLADKLHARHYHPRYPEKDDVSCRNQDGRRIKGSQIVSVIRTTES